MAYLEDGPKDLIFLFSVTRRILSIFHLIAKLKQCVFNIVKAGRRRFAISGCANGWHDELVRRKSRDGERLVRDATP